MSTLRNFRPYFLGAFGMAVMAMIISPEVRSAAAALVSVTNTFTNPVPTRGADNPAFQGFGTRLFPSARNISTIVVPAGKYLVLTDISGFHNGTTAYGVSIDVQSSGQIQEQKFPFDNFTYGLRYLRDGHTFLVADPGSTVYVYVDDLNDNDTAGINVDLHGYYVSAN